jgi:hypothetical protein
VGTTITLIEAGNSATKIPSTITDTINHHVVEEIDSRHISTIKIALAEAAVVTITTIETTSRTIETSIIIILDSLVRDRP